jgi:hypothetical protein
MAEDGAGAIGLLAKPGRCSRCGLAYRPFIYLDKLTRKFRGWLPRDEALKAFVDQWLHIAMEMAVSGRSMLSGSNEFRCGSNCRERNGELDWRLNQDRHTATYLLNVTQVTLLR